MQFHGSGSAPTQQETLGPNRRSCRRDSQLRTRGPGMTNIPAAWCRHSRSWTTICDGRHGGSQMLSVVPPCLRRDGVHVSAYEAAGRLLLVTGLMAEIGQGGPRTSQPPTQRLVPHTHLAPAAGHSHPSQPRSGRIGRVHGAIHVAAFSTTVKLMTAASVWWM